MQPNISKKTTLIDLKLLNGNVHEIDSGVTKISTFITAHK